MAVLSKSTIDLAKNPVSHGRSKHIETKFHFLRDQVCRGRIGLHHCPTEVQVADILTKRLKTKRFLMLRKMLNIVCFSCFFSSVQYCISLELLNYREVLKE